MSAHDRPPSPLTVLIVDDDLDTVESLAELLGFHGYVTRVASDGDDALRQAEAEPPDVVLLDLWMPRMDGYTVAHALRARARDKRPLLIAVTGCGNVDDHTRTTDAGFDLHLVKPVEPDIIISVLERFCQVLAPPLKIAEPEPHPEDPPGLNCSELSLIVSCW